MTTEDRDARLAEIDAHIEYLKLCNTLRAKQERENLQWLISELESADNRAKEMAGLLENAADELENASLYHLSDFRTGCTRCDGEIGSEPTHDADCLIAQMRTAADHAAKDPAP